MATITKLSSGSWRAQVRRKGRYASESFKRLRDAQEWAIDIERSIDRYRTFRILLTKPEQFAIDVVAHDEVHAVERAEAAWYRGDRSRFEKRSSHALLRFEPDEQACLHLADAGNDDRSDWAACALRAYSAKTGSDMGDEGVGDLIADLGHYADTNKLDFIDVVRTALANWSVERRVPECKNTPQVTIQFGAGGDP
jgi:hypothetical protein